MKRFFFRQGILLPLLWTLLITMALPGQAQNWQQFASGGGFGDDRGTKVATDASGNKYVVGSFRGTAFFGNTGALSSSAGSEDLFVAKLSPTGQYLWAVRAGSVTADRATDVAVDRFDNLYITGYFSGTAIFGGGSGASGITLATPFAYNAFVAKLNPASGAWIWAVPASTSESQGLGLAVDDGGTLYLTGHFKGTAVFGQQTLNSFNTTATDLFVAAMSPSQQMWFLATRGGGAGDDAGTSIAVADSSANVFVTGYFSTGAPGILANFDNITLSSNGGRDAFVGRYSFNGWQWVTKGGGAGDDAGSGVALDFAGNVYVAGRFSSSSSAGTVSFGNTTFATSGAAGSTNAYVGRLSSAGSWQWVTRSSAQDSNEANDVAVDNAGNVYVTGAYGAAGSTFGTTTLPSRGATDVFVARLSGQGTWQWAVNAGGPAADYGSGLVADAAGNLTLVGAFDSDTAQFGPFWAGACCGANAYDVFVARLTPGTQALSVGAFTPASGPVGTTVTITGTGFTGVQNVRFNGTNATSVTVQSSTQLQVFVPVGATTGPIIVQTAQGIAASSGNFTVTTSPPVVTTFTPTSGPVGTVVTITGANFTGATQVRFGGTNAPGFTINSATQITATVPVGANSGLISVVSPAGLGSSSSVFTVAPPPTITSFTPTSGKAGITVTITGTNFTGASAVTFNGVAAASYAVASATSITAVVPTTAGTGPLRVTTAGGSATSAASFTVQPVFGAFSPAAGASVGATVTITGSGLLATTGVLFNGIAAAGFTVVSATQLTAVVPATATTGKITVQTAAGTVLSTSIFKVIPTVSSFTPMVATPHAPATVVTITGTGFLGATGVKIGTGVCPAGTFTVVNATTITATVPAAATTGKISVTTPGGTGSSTTTIGVAPTVSSFLPAVGAPGSVVLLMGLNFTSTTAVKFNGTPATVTYNSATQVTAVVPTGATSGPLTVTTAYGTHTSANSYTIVAGPAPTITSFAPTANVIAGTMVTITGTGFTGASIVRFNNVNASSFTLLSSTQVQAAVPAIANSGKVYVVTPKGMAQSATSLAIIKPPVVASMAPASGSPGSVVLLGGSNLLDATSVKLNGAPVPFEVTSSAQIVATVPAGATSGKFSVTTIAGTGQSSATFTVTSSPAPPTITALSATSAPRGATITLTGTNFTGVTSVRIKTLVLAATDYTVLSATQLRLTVPATAATGYIYVAAAGGMAQSPLFTVALPPTISSFSPASGRVGTLVTISGGNFLSTSAVKFGGVAATSFTVVSNTRITATVPAGAVTGAVEVVNPAATATASRTFTLLGPRAVVAESEVPEVVQVEVFPNPATEWIGLELSGATSVELLDAQGNVVRTLTAEAGYTRLSVMGLPKGLYLVRAAGHTQRVLVE